MNFIHHYLWQDLWSPVWPNWVAGIGASIVLWFWKGKAWFRKHEEHQKRVAEIHAHLLKGKK